MNRRKEMGETLDEKKDLESFLHLRLMTGTQELCTML